MISTVNPKMLIVARESRGLTQSVLAQKIGVAQGTISKAEAGQSVGDDLVTAYAEALDYPPKFFYQPHEFRHLPVVFYRKRKTISAVDYRKIEAAANIVRGHLAALKNHAQPPDPVLPRVDLSKTKMTPEAVAQEVRVRWHIPAGPIDNLTRVLEDNGVIVIQHDFGECKVYGLSVWEPKDDVPPFILINNSMPGDRWRFTLAHELGHLVLHHHLPLPGDDCEREADMFASEFLMPSAEIRGYLTRPTLETLASLKAHWKVSIQSLIMKAESLGQITPKQKSRLMISLSSLGWRTNEPVEIPREAPTLISELFEYIVNTRGLNEAKLMDIMCLKPDEMYQRYPIPRPKGLRLIKLAE